MVDFEVGQIFLDRQATNFIGQTKPKYYISLSIAEYDDDEIICFVFNSEKHMYRYIIGCNKDSQKFILVKDSFDFITKETSIMLNEPVCYKLSEMYGENIKLSDIAENILCRQIKNCLDYDYINPRFKKNIVDSFKSLPK